MTSEPTSALTFGDLILEVATKLGLAYYGTDGTEEAQVPVDPHDLAECKRLVNQGIRRLISDAPANGWRTLRPIASVVLWPSIAATATTTATGVYVPSRDQTLVTASEDVFYESMEEKTLTVTDVGDATMKAYVSATQIYADGDQHWTGAKTFAVTADGNYTLPRSFGGTYTGPITYIADSARGVAIQWGSESEIRRYRENLQTSTGTPTIAAVRRLTSQNRRWELLVDNTPSDVETIQFPYDYYFDTLVELTDLHPFGYAFDDVVRAACFAVMEKDYEDLVAGEVQDYMQRALPNGYRIDARTAPKNLGYCGNPGTARITARNVRDFQRRPTVTYGS